MRSITFETRLPHNHVPRVLDILRTMGFELAALSILRQDDDVYQVDLSYEPKGSLSEQTFVHRIAGLSAITVVRPSLVPMQACA